MSRMRLLWICLVGLLPACADLNSKDYGYCKDDNDVEASQFCREDLGIRFARFSIEIKSPAGGGAAVNGGVVGIEAELSAHTNKPDDPTGLDFKVAPGKCNGGSAATDSLTSSGPTSPVTDSNGTHRATYKADFNATQEGDFCVHVSYPESMEKTVDIHVDKTAPVVTFTSTPPDPSVMGSANFAFAFSEDTNTSQCSIDGAPFANCPSQQAGSYVGLSDGAHTLTVKVLDRVGNIGQTQFTWHIRCANPNIYVDAANGSNANAGNTPNAAYQTITYALSKATTGQTIKVLPGTYNSSIGESFPLNVPEGVCVVGDVANKGNGATPTFVSGCGTTRVPENPRSATFKLGKDAVVAGIRTDDLSCNAFYSDSSGAIIHSNSALGNPLSLSDNIAATIGANASGYCISSNVVSSIYIGIVLATDNPGKLEYNSVNCNAAGADLIGVTHADFGLGPFGSAGLNNLSCNAGFGGITIENASGTVYAGNNYWENQTPTTVVGSTGMSAGIWMDSANTAAKTRVITTSALKAPACQCP